jgi:WD40 repeat protein/energy-coupling factor transporter ATP-binding protein EcfA2
MSRQPYIGLRAFSREEQALFFGREQHSNELIQRLNEQHFLAVVGDSGCGKSSLIKAGLIPSLQAGFLADAGSHWRIVETRPTNEPFANLAKALCEDNALGKDYETALMSNQFLTRSPFSLHELLAIKPLPNNAKLLIVCDQFEELFRYAKQQSNSEEAAAFAALLLASANPYPLASGEMSNSVYVILTMRSDYLGNCAQFAGLAEAINQGLYLTPRLNRQQLRDAIERPALVCNGKVEPALLVRLLAETGNDADQLPLLQHLLMRLWDNAKQARDNIPSRDVIPQRLIIKLTDYQDDKKIQTLKNALSTHADEAYNELNQAQQLIAKQIFCRLTGAESGKNDTRNPTKVSELMALTNQSLEDITAILKVFRQTGRSFLLPTPDIELTTDTVIDITHESLIRNWERLEQWTQEESESASIYRRLEQNALLHDKGEYGFYRTPELETTLNWQQKNPVTAQWASRYGQHFELAMAFLQRSLQEQQAEQERERLAQQREIAQTRAKQRWLFSGLVLACALTAWAWKERNHAWKIEGQRVVELFQSRLTHASLLAKQEDYAAAKKVLAETDALDEQVSPSLRHARNLLHSFTQIKGGEAEQVYTGAGYPLGAVAISPDGQLVAAAGEHGTLVVFDVQTGKLLQRLLGHKTDGAGENSSVRSIAFTPSGQQLISAGDDKKIIIWQRSNTPTLSKPIKPDTQTGKPLVSLNNSATEPVSADLFQPQQTLDAADKVTAISISPDGKLLASGGYDKAITLWELNSGKKLKTLSQHRERISSKGLAFSPDGRYLASASYDDTAIIWHLATGEPSQVLTGHTGDVNQLSFSADSATLVTASEDKTLRLWEVATGKSLRVFNGHQNRVFAVSWFGDYLLSGSADHSIRVLDSDSGVSLRLLQGHESGVTAFALYGGQLWSASNDGTVRRWSLKLPFQQAWSLPSKPFSTVITPALNHIAVGFANGDLSVYDVQKPKPVWHKPAAHSDIIKRLTVNQNGSLLATGSFDNTAKIWQIQQTTTGIALQESQTLSGHKDTIHALAFSPDSLTLATASYNGQIGLFTVNQTKPAQFITPAHQGMVSSVEFDNTGKQLVSSGFEDRSLKLWNLQTNPPTSKNFPLANYIIVWSSISPDGLKLVSVGGNQAVDVYDSLSTQPLYHLIGHKHTISRAVFAPDSQSVATVSIDKTVKFWQLEQGKELFSLALPTEDMDTLPVWDFDFRCLKDKCLIAVPLVRGQLQLYTLAYEGKLTEDANEQKRQQVDLWRLYLNTVDKLLLSNATQPALQASHETEQLAQHFNQQFPNDAEFATLKKHGDCQQQKIQQLLKPESPALSTDC